MEQRGGREVDGAEGPCQLLRNPPRHRHDPRRGRTACGGEGRPRDPPLVLQCAKYSPPPSLSSPVVGPVRRGPTGANPLDRGSLKRGAGWAKQGQRPPLCICVEMGATTSQAGRGATSKGAMRWGAAPWGRANNILGGGEGVSSPPLERVSNPTLPENQKIRPLGGKCQPERNLDARQEWNPLPGDPWNGEGVCMINPPERPRVCGVGPPAERTADWRPADWRPATGVSVAMAGRGRRRWHGVRCGEPIATHMVERSVHTKGGRTPIRRRGSDPPTMPPGRSGGISSGGRLSERGPSPGTLQVRSARRTEHTDGRDPDATPPDRTGTRRKVLRWPPMASRGDRWIP